jgi:hypothetical protein
MPLPLTIPESIAGAIRVPEDRLSTEVRCEPRAVLFRHRLFSHVSRFTFYPSRPAFGKARELAGLGEYEFSQLLAARGVTRHYTREGLQDDLDYADPVSSSRRAVRRGMLGGSRRSR